MRPVTQLDSSAGINHPSIAYHLPGWVDTTSTKVRKQRKMTADDRKRQKSWQTPPSLQCIRLQQMKSFARQAVLEGTEIGKRFITVPSFSPVDIPFPLYVCHKQLQRAIYIFSIISRLQDRARTHICAARCTFHSEQIVQLQDHLPRAGTVR